MHVRIGIAAGLLAATLFAGLLDRAAAPAVAQAAQHTATPTATPAPPFSAGVLAQAEFLKLPSGASIVSLVSITLPTGVATRSFENQGPALIFVSGGEITFDADLAVVSQAGASAGVLQPVTPTPAPAHAMLVTAGEQALLPAAGTVTLRNEGTVTTTLLIILIAPEAGGAGSTGA